MAPYLRPHRRGGQGSARSRPANHLYYSMTSLLSHLRTHLARTRLLGEPGVALVAVSGGADSVALLDLLHTLAPELGLSLVVAHVDHGIRSDSGTVARAVGELAERYELPFEVGELTLGPDATETVARRARYAWLGEVQRRHGARYLVTAHHRDDQVETILLRLLKGSAPGSCGRCSPSRRRDSWRTSPSWASPFTTTPRTAIRDTCAAGCAPCSCRWSASAWGRAWATTCSAPGERPRASGALGTGCSTTCPISDCASSGTASKLPGGGWPAMMTSCLRRCCVRRHGVAAWCWGCVARASWSS